MTNENDRRKHLLLLISPNTYRAGAFLDAASRLDVDVVRGIDVPTQLTEMWDIPLPLDFANVEAATAAIVAYAAKHPLDAIVALDDSGTLIATRAAAALGLPHNPLEAAEATRDKG
ncbi:MAG: ATP-grasp domain-containing protein, partial [Ktedonobacterales bacterium]